MSEHSLTSRRFLLRAMLVSLGLAAAAGILGVLAPDGSDVVWRLVGTAFVTAIGCALMLAAARFIEKPERRLSSLCGMLVVLLEYLLGLTLIWEIPRTLFGSGTDESVGMTMLCVAAAGLPATAIFGMVRKPSTRIAAIVGLILIGIGFLTMLVAAWMSGHFWENSDVAWCGFWIEVYAFPILGCLVGFGRGDRRYWRWIGVIAAAAACFMLIFSVVRHVEDSSPIPFVWATVVAVILAHLNVSLHAPLTAGQTWLRILTVLAVAVTGALVGMQVTVGGNSEMIARLIAASGICAGCGSMAMAIIARMNRKSEREMIAPAEIASIELHCPGCQKKQRVPLGESACVECGLRFAIKVDEPRCETCGYLLYRLKSDRCPECGTAIVAMKTGLLAT